MCEASAVITGGGVEVGDVLLALASSGVHSNGYSLVRKVIEVTNTDVHTQTLESGTKLADALMAPTRIYVKSVNALQKSLGNANIHAMAHITGGGLTENLPRVLPKNLAAQIDTSSWVLPEVFQWLQHGGNIDTLEMYRTFNCGVGFILVVPADQAKQAMNKLTAEGEQVWQIGQIIERTDDAVVYA